MKKLNLILLLLTGMAFSQITYADETSDDVINVKVNGLVCDFCSRSIEKVFAKQEAVKEIKVDLDQSQVTIYTQQGVNIDDDTIKKLIHSFTHNSVFSS